MPYKDPVIAKEYLRVKRKQYREDVKAGVRIPVPWDKKPKRMAFACEHIDRVYFCKGLCESCYTRKRYNEKHPNKRLPNMAVNCEHTDQPSAGIGLCRSCYSHDHYEKNKDKYKASARKSAKNKPRIYNRYAQIKQKHGVEVLTFYRHLLVVQNNSCYCGFPFDDTWEGAPRLDHDHACCPHNSRLCGLCIRGLLCNSCNRVLGIWEDKIHFLPDHLQKYLKAYEEKRHVRDIFGLRDEIDCCA